MKIKQAQINSQEEYLQITKVTTVCHLLSTTPAILVLAQSLFKLLSFTF